ncbi:MAG: SoxR reducing system RseC family protein [Oscillospiraceae bacterium]|jgi:sigma-E factor negative regulatory protein RseC|nr:SoxR reducing system RseC family protein [Oscillospiraceae bacterium]
MQQQAVIKRVLNTRTALVEVRRLSACGHDCAACGGLCADGARVLVKAANPLGGREGDVVTVRSETGQILKWAALVYLAPVGLFFLGYVLGALFAGVSPAMTGLAGFVCGFVCIWLGGRRLGRRGGVAARIVAVEGTR